MLENIHNYQQLISTPSLDECIVTTARFTAHFCAIGGNVEHLQFHVSGTRGSVTVGVSSVEDTAVFQIRSICSSEQGYT